MNARLDTIDTVLFAQRRGRGDFNPVAARRSFARFESHRYIGHKEWRTGALFGTDIAIVTRQQRRRRPTSNQTPTLFFVKRIARSSASERIWETQNYVGFILTDESLLSSWPPYPLLPFSIVLRLPLLLLVQQHHPSFRSRARLTIPREPVIFTPKWPVSSNWTTIIRTIATRIIATVMGRITAPEVISLIVKDCPCPCLRHGRW